MIDLPKEYQNQPIVNRPGRHLLAGVLGWLLLDMFYPKPTMSVKQFPDGKVYTFTARRFGEKYVTHATDAAIVGIAGVLSKDKSEERIRALQGGFVLIHPKMGGFCVPDWAVGPFLDSLTVVAAQEYAEWAQRHAQKKAQENDDKPTLH